jgi:Zn finger protein HypA/HybF involved in hydrogenase expression
MTFNFKGEIKTIKRSCFECDCGNSYNFINGKYFHCDNCDDQWQLSDYGEQALRRIEIDS